MPAGGLAGLGMRGGDSPGQPASAAAVAWPPRSDAIRRSA